LAPQASVGLERNIQDMRVKGIGRVTQVPIQFQATNEEDLIRAQHGWIAPNQVRRVLIKGAVDPRVCHLLLPKSVVKRLGLRKVGKVKIRKRGQRPAKGDQVRFRLEIVGRQGTYSAAVDPKRRSALIGFLVLEDLDLLVDCVHRRVLPRNKRFITTEIE
jgi:hypothetical protein